MANFNHTTQGALSIPCQRCSAGIGEPCIDVRDGQEAFGCIAHCHEGQCGIVYDTLKHSGLWILTKTGDWENYRNITLETAAATYPHMWERVRGTYGDRYRSWYRGRWLGIFQRFSWYPFPVPFDAEDREQLTLW